MWTLLEVLQWTTKRFVCAGFTSPRLDAEVLLAHVLSKSRIDLYTGFDQVLGERELERYRNLVRLRVAGQPVAYLVGEQEFWSRAFTVSPAVLIPRRDTETLIEVVLERLPKGEPWRILDVGTGSGVLAITLAMERPLSRIWAVEPSAAALAIAAQNAERYQLGDQCTWIAGSLLAPVSGLLFDAVVANLPYIPTGELPQLAPSVRAEPALALNGGPDGLGLIRELVAGVLQHLVAGGLLALEHGFEQGAAVAAMMERAGLAEPVLVKDLAGHDRVVVARRQG